MPQHFKMKCSGIFLPYKDFPVVSIRAGKA